MRRSSRSAFPKKLCVNHEIDNTRLSSIKSQPKKVVVVVVVVVKMNVVRVVVVAVIGLVVVIIVSHRNQNLKFSQNLVNNS